MRAEPEDFMIRLHGGPTPNARKIAIALIEMDLPWELVDVDILALPTSSRRSSSR